MSEQPIGGSLPFYTGRAQGHTQIGVCVGKRGSCYPRHRTVSQNTGIPQHTHTLELKVEPRGPAVDPTPPLEIEETGFKAYIHDSLALVLNPRRSIPDPRPGPAMSLASPNFTCSAPGPSSLNTEPAAWGHYTYFLPAAL